MALGIHLQDASVLQLAETLASKSDQVSLQLERLPSHLRKGAGSRGVGDSQPELQHAGKPELKELKHPTSSSELTNTLWTATSRIFSAINETRPIYRLPPEVLARIFGWYQRLDSVQRYGSWYLWAQLMSVSQAWRSTILSFPSLWSEVYLSSGISQEAFQTLLQRSGSHPLDIIIPRGRLAIYTSRANRYSHALDTSAHTSRIRTFTLYEDGPKDVKRLAEIFSKPAPNLTHLKLVVSYISVDPTSFPNFFGLEFPKLRVLEVNGLGAWPEIVGRNLTHLTITDALESLLFNGCISYSPNLKVLKIQGIWNSDLEIWASPKIALPSGIRLVTKYGLGCPKILSLFALPPDSFLRVKPSMVVDWTPSRPLLSHILPRGINDLQNLRALTRLHVKADLDAKITLQLNCFRLDRPAFEVKIRYSPALQEVTGESAFPVMGVLDNLEGIVLREVGELRMEGFVGNLEPQAEELLAFFGRMPVLTKVITTDKNEEKLRSVLDVLDSRAAVIGVDQRS